MNATLSQRYNYSYQHFEAAILFYKSAKCIEEEYRGEKFASFFTDVRSYVTGSVIMTASALEANINECFTDVRDRIYVIRGLDVDTYFHNWESIVRQPTITKYCAYLGAHGLSMDRLSDEYTRVSKLSIIRNEMIHYKPQWDEEKTAENKLEEIISEFSEEITFSAFIPETAPYFPMRCMTNSFAKWAINTALNFIEWIDKKVGIESRFGQFRSKLEEV